MQTYYLILRVLSGLTWLMQPATRSLSNSWQTLGATRKFGRRFKKHWQAGKPKPGLNA